jgi:hypothetical protein
MLFRSDRWVSPGNARIGLWVRLQRLLSPEISRGACPSVDRGSVKEQGSRLAELIWGIRAHEPSGCTKGRREHPRSGRQRRSEVSPAARTSGERKAEGREQPATDGGQARLKAPKP